MLSFNFQFKKVFGGQPRQDCARKEPWKDARPPGSVVGSQTAMWGPSSRQGRRASGPVQDRGTSPNYFSCRIVLDLSSHLEKLKPIWFGNFLQTFKTIVWSHFWILIQLGFSYGQKWIDTLVQIMYLGVEMFQGMCQNLMCRTPHRSGYYFAGPALDGTTCSPGKVSIIVSK